MTAHVHDGRFGGEFGKDAEMIVHEREPYNAEPPPARLRESFITPAPLFYVRNHAPVPEVDAKSFRLNVGGETKQTLDITLAELKSRFPVRTVTATLQCAGNRRDKMIEIAPIAGEVPWGAQAVGTARWTGVRLADVLTLAGIGGDARHVHFLGADRVEKHGERFGFGGSIPIAKAMRDEVLLAFGMNDEELTPVHGAPLRVVVPGYIGARSVKWLEKIEVAREPSENYYQRKTYKLYPKNATPENASTHQGIMLGALNVNSCITRPADNAGVEAGRIRFEGYATAGGEQRVERVELSADDGETWHVADFDVAQFDSADDSAWAWRFWSAEIELAPGLHRVTVRAWDSAANTQPARPAEIWNFKGYMNNARHVVTVHARG